MERQQPCCNVCPIQDIKKFWKVTSTEPVSHHKSFSWLYNLYSEYQRMVNFFWMCIKKCLFVKKKGNISLLNRWHFILQISRIRFFSFKTLCGRFLVCFSLFIAGWCMTNPWCQNAYAGLRKQTTGRKFWCQTNFSGILVFLHFHLIFQYHIVTPCTTTYSPSVCGHARCILLLPAVWMCRMYLSPSLAVWTCREKLTCVAVTILTRCKDTHKNVIEVDSFYFSPFHLTLYGEFTH